MIYFHLLPPPCLQPTYVVIKLCNRVWTSPTSEASTLQRIFQDICGLLFCFSSCCKVLQYLAGFKVIKHFGFQWEALSYVFFTRDF